MIQDKTNRINAVLAIVSAPLYLDIFPISRNTSLASWSAKTIDPTRANLNVLNIEEKTVIENYQSKVYSNKIELVWVLGPKSPTSISHMHMCV